MPEYHPSTHFTCANCKRRLPNAKARKGTVVCKDRASCMAATAAYVETIPAVQTPVTRA